MNDPMKRCPACAELIQAAARKCRYCGTDIEAYESAHEASVEQTLFAGHPKVIYTFGQYVLVVCTLGLALLRLISSDGPIVFLGNNIQGLRFKAMRPFRRDMQIVFQDPFGSLSPRMSVGDIIAEGLTVHQKALSRDEREVRVVKALQDVGLDPETRFRYPHEFSGGQRQRISIARAVVLEPNFVVLDEPTSALDMLFQAQMVDLLRELQRKRDLTYMFISHDLRVVASLASHLIVMRQGKVVEEGPASELFKRPKTDYTRELFAAAFRLETSPDGGVVT